jgi:curved DNA-binding protein CbpA
MTIRDYYRILGLREGCTPEDVKKAYRNKAREFHPDINHSPEAKDQFILITEAYEFLITYRKKELTDDEAYSKAMDDWRKYRQDRSRQKARVYARTSYKRFKNTKFYKTTKILDGTTIIASFIVAVMVLIYSVVGYFYRIHHPIPGVENPTILNLIEFLIFGMILFSVSFIFLKAYIETFKKRRKNEKNP